MKIFICLCLITFAPINIVHAGPYIDELAKCLVESTSTEDRTELVKWLFATATRHPSVSEMTVVSDEVLAQKNIMIGALVKRLLADSCKTQAEQAYNYEGDRVIENSFEVLDSVAGQELFSSPKVAAAFANLANYLDPEKLKHLNVKP